MIEKCCEWTQSPWPCPTARTPLAARDSSPWRMETPSQNRRSHMLESREPRRAAPRARGDHIARTKSAPSCGPAQRMRTDPVVNGEWCDFAPGLILVRRSAFFQWFGSKAVEKIIRSLSAIPMIVTAPVIPDIDWGRMYLEDGPAILSFCSGSCAPAKNPADRLAAAAGAGLRMPSEAEPAGRAGCGGQWLGSVGRHTVEIPTITMNRYCRARICCKIWNCKYSPRMTAQFPRTNLHQTAVFLAGSGSPQSSRN